LLLSLKKKPLIRFERNSEMAKRLANELNVSSHNIHLLIHSRIHLQTFAHRETDSGSLEED